MKIDKYSFGVGDRFGKEGKAQLAAVEEINKMGIPLVPVWNKSFREHTIVRTTQASLRKEADEAVKGLKWTKNYYVDADHIGLQTVDNFLDYSDFFTIDVAHFIGQPADDSSRNEFVKRHSRYIGKLNIPGIEKEFMVDKQFLEATADKYLKAITEVEKIYIHILVRKGKDRFIAEVSMDETDQAQTPLDMFFILAELKLQGVEVQTIAPKFSGLFAKGVDYEGNVKLFAREFEEDVAVVKFAVKELGLSDSLKLSVHSGSDKFSIYPAMSKAIKKFDAGIHIKTAGTTWLEEVIGLSRAGGKGLKIAKHIYSRSLERYDELAGPYATVLHIDRKKLPTAEIVNKWTSEQFTDALVHNAGCPAFNPNFRQLIHIGYKIAAEMGNEFLDALDDYREIIEENVKYNILERHLKLLFT
jgi:tagaturonate epimerase